MKMITPVAQMRAELATQSDDAIFAEMVGMQPGELSSAPSEDATYLGAAALINSVELHAAAPVPAQEQTDLFGNRVSGVQEYSVERAGQDTQDIRLLVGRVLVETAAEINDEQMTKDAAHYMNTWDMQAQYKEMMQQHFMMEHNHEERSRAEAEREDTSSSRSSMTSVAGLRKSIASKTKKPSSTSRPDGKGPRGRNDSVRPSGVRIRAERPSVTRA